MIKLKAKTFLSLIIISLLGYSCIYPKLKRVMNDSVEPVITANHSFKRNSYQNFSINDTLVSDQENDLSGLPAGSLLRFSGNLVFTTTNGYLYFVELNKLQKFTKKQITDGIEAAPTINDSIMFIPIAKGNYGLLIYDMLEGSILFEMDGMLSQSSPVIFEKSVIHASLDGDITCIDITSFEEKWSFQLDDNIHNSLALYKDNLIVTTQNGIIRNYNPATGTLNWSREINDAIYASPVTDGESIFIASYKGKILKIDLMTGDILTQKGYNIPIFFPPVIDKDFIYVPISDGRLLKLTKENLNLVWAAKLEAPFRASLLLSNDKIIAGTAAKDLFIIEKSNGAIYQKIKLKGRIQAQPVFYKDKLYVSYEPNILLTFKTGQSIDE